MPMISGLTHFFSRNILQFLLEMLLKANPENILWV